MKFKTTNLGIILLSLLLLIGLFLFFNHSVKLENILTSNNKKQSEKAILAKSEGNQGKHDPVTSLNVEEKNNPTEKSENTRNTQAQKNVVSDGASATAETDKSKKEGTVQSKFLVVIDPGHQSRANTDPEPIGPGAKETKMEVTGGTSGVATGKPEYKLTLEASLILGHLLESRGVKVIYTRTTNDVNISNRERAEVANQNTADLYVRIHADGSTNRNVHGLSVLTPSNTNPYTKSIYEDSLKASQFIIEETKKNSSVKVNGISYRDDMSGFNWSKVPCTLVELGFMTNPIEDKNLSDPIYQNNLLTNLADGIMQYASYKKND